MHENEISSFIVDSAVTIHQELGPGLFESVYETILATELESKGLKVLRQQGIPVIWRGRRLDQGFRADLIVEDKVIVEIKSIEAIAPVHHKQLLTYLRLTDKRLGLLLNFNEALMKHGLHRVVNNLQ